MVAAPCGNKNGDDPALKTCSPQKTKLYKEIDEHFPKKMYLIEDPDIDGEEFFQDSTEKIYSYDVGLGRKPKKICNNLLEFLNLEYEYFKKYH